MAFRSAEQVLATMEHVWIEFSIGHFQCKEDVAFSSAEQVAGNNGRCMDRFLYRSLSV